MATRAIRLPAAKKAVKRAPKAPSKLEERFARDLRADWSEQRAVSEPWQMRKAKG